MYIAGEIGRRGEAEHVGDLNKREVLVAQESGDVEHGVTVDPEVGTIATYTFCHLGEILRRDAELGGIVAHLAVGAVVTAIEHRHELPHDLSIVTAHRRVAIEVGVEVERIEDERLHSVDDGVVTKMIVGVGHAIVDVDDVLRHFSA